MEKQNSATKKSKFTNLVYFAKSNGCTLFLFFIIHSTILVFYCTFKHHFNALIVGFIVTTVAVSMSQNQRTFTLSIQKLILNECVALTIRDKMLRHMEGNLDSERAGILRSIDNGNDTCADGDQRQGDLI